MEITGDTPAARMDAAQSALEALVADTAALAQATRLVRDSTARHAAFRAYFEGRWADDRDELFAVAGPGPTPPVAGEDVPWEAVVDHDDALRRLLRAVVAAVTADVEG